MNAMQAVSMNVHVESLPLKSPFRISGYTFTDVEVVVVTLTSNGLQGRGEASGVYYLDDKPAGMVVTLEQHRQAIEAGISREELLKLMPPGGARNALDCALWELESKRAGKPVWQLAGLSRAVPKITTFTLGADDPATMAAGARAVADAKSLKLKLSGEIDVDAERVRAVRAARPDVWMGVDANQGFTLDSLTTLMPVLVQAKVQLVEQPLKRGKEAELTGYRSPIILAADESVQGVDEMEQLAGRFDVVNIKLDKCGGLTEALAMVKRAGQMGLKVMVGNMVGTSLSTAPGFIVAQWCDFVDLDGPTFLAADSTPSVVYRDGEIWCPEQVWGATA